MRRELINMAQHDDGNDGISRREFLGGLAATVAATPLVISADQAIPRRPNPNSNPNQPPSGGSSSGKTLLTKDDFKYTGMFTLPFAGDLKLGFSNGAIAGRHVGSDVHLFVCGGKPSGDPVVEVVFTGAGRDLLQAPRAQLVRNWGDIYSGKRAIASGGGIVTRGLLWANDQLYWAFGDEYNVAGNHDPSIGSTVLNADGSMRTYGPWRTDEHSQKTRGYMVPIPDWFKANTSGRGFAVGAPITSGNATSPWGAMLDAVTFPDNSTAADKPGDSHSSIQTQRLVYHDIDHKQKRDSNYKFCGWNQQYDCSKGTWTKPGTPEFNGIDMVTAAAWIDLPNKHGVVFVGQISTAIPGYAYGGGDTVPHYWYGPSVCCHGQVSESSQATGDSTGSSVPYFWIYDPNDLARAAQKKADPWSFEPTSIFPAFQIGSIPNHAGALYLFGGAWYDPDSKQLFLSQIFSDPVAPEPQPIIHVISVG
jgi:hypothetical protein